MVKKKEEVVSSEEIKISASMDEYIKNKIDDEVESAVSKAEKKLLKVKNIAIIKRDIIIIILIFFYVLLGYNLYNTNYFDKFLSKYIKTDNSVSVSDESSLESESTSKKEEKNELLNKEKLISKYEPLLDNINFYDLSTNFKDFASGELTDEVKEEIVFNSLDKNDFDSSAKLISVDAEKVKSIGERYFTSFTLKDFNYNNLKVHYMEDDSLFIFKTSDNKKSELISKKIIDAEESIDKKSVKVRTLYYTLEDNKLINPITLKEIKGYKNNDDIVKFKKELPKVTLVFNVYDAGIYKLDEVVNDVEE